MGSVGQAVGGVVGGVVGFFVGGPAGAVYGAQIGMAVGGVVDQPSQTIQGPQIGELAAQTSKEGVPRPIVFGIARPIGGNIIATTRPEIRIVREKQSGGKGGGGSTTVEREEVYRTYAIRICEGPITAIRRVWRNGKLVYDTTSQSSTATNNRAEFLKKATFYLGSFRQNPDPTLQSAFGSNNVVPHRGTAYMVIDDENLTELGGAIPQYQFEVERCEGYAVTSKPYRLEVLEEVESFALSANDTVLPWALDEASASASGIVSGEMTSTLNEYSIDPEEIDAAASGIVSGEMPNILNEYSIDPEEIDATASGIVSAEMPEILIRYEWEAEEIDAKADGIMSGELI